LKEKKNMPRLKRWITGGCPTNWLQAALALIIALPQMALAANWNFTGSLNVGRDAHTATLLSNGQVLVAAGYDGSVLASAELYDPITGTWSPTGSLNDSRSHHTATLLSNGQVLVTGGNVDDSQRASAELYDPTLEIWSPSGSLSTARQDHTATLLPDGKVLVVGGVVGPLDDVTTLSSAELYDPVSGIWSPTGSLNNARFLHTATLVNGKVLVAGGVVGRNRADATPLNSAELYDPISGTWSPTGSLNDARHDYTATLLADGQVLVTGGYGDDDACLASAELYDPVSGAWSATGSLHAGRALHSASLLPSGMVLVPGGECGSGYFISAELYDPVAGTWSTTGSLDIQRVRYTATVLVNGQVLVAGGYDGSAVLSSAELFGCSSIVITGLNTDMTAAPRAGDSVTLTVSAINCSGGEVYYRFDLVPNYGTSDYDPMNIFQTIQDFSTSNTCTHTFTESGSYVVVVWGSATASIPSGAAPMFGGSITVE
jgi:hypothetical protein